MSRRSLPTKVCTNYPTKIEKMSRRGGDDGSDDGSDGDEVSRK